MTIPLWLDCDPGHDDAFAILMAAHHPALRLLGISTVFGNAPIQKTSESASSLLTAMAKEAEVTVYPGAEKPFLRPSMHVAAEIHGESGIDGTDLLPAPLAKIDQSVSAVDAMARALRQEAPGTAWIVATGTVTNIAHLLDRHPDLIEHVAGISIMGGAIGNNFSTAVMGTVDGEPRAGNWSRWAEFNIIIDPEAADFLFSNPAIARKMIMAPLDLTHQAIATADIQNMLLHGRDAPVDGPGLANEPKKGRQGKTRLRQMLVELLIYFHQTYRDVYGLKDGPPLHDPLAVAVLLTDLADPEQRIPFYDWNIFDTTNPQPTRERFHVTVDTHGTLEEAQKLGLTTGQTVAKPVEYDPSSQQSERLEGVTIPRSLDVAQFWRVLEACIQRADDAVAQRSQQ